MTFQYATKEQAGIYEVVGELWSDLDPGDWGVLRTGEVRMVFSRRRAAAGGLLPIIDWHPSFVRDGQLRKARERVHEKALDQHTRLRRKAWDKAASRFREGMAWYDLQGPILDAVTTCPGLPTGAFVDLVTRHLTMADVIGAAVSHTPLVLDAGPEMAVQEALQGLVDDGFIQRRYLPVGPGWGRNNTERWYRA